MTRAVDEAVERLRAGGIVAYPTDTLLGLGAMVTRPEAVQRVFAVKGRPRDQPLSIAVASPDTIQRYAVVTPLARRLFALLPGAVTLVLERRPSVPDVVTGGAPGVGVRVPNHRTALELLSKAGALTATSANRHGVPEPATLEDARAQLGDRVDYYLASPTPLLGVASTLVDARGATPHILRAGAVTDGQIRECLRE